MRAPALTPEQHERETLGILAAIDPATNALVVRLSSPHGAIRLTDTNLPPLTMRVREAIDAGVCWMRLDLSACLDISAKGMGVLLSMRNALKRRGGGVTIVGADEHVRALFDVYDIASAFTFTPSEVLRSAEHLARPTQAPEET